MTLTRRKAEKRKNLYSCLVLSKDNAMQTDQQMQISGKGGDRLPFANRKRGEIQGSIRLYSNIVSSEIK